VSNLSLGGTCPTSVVANTNRVSGKQVKEARFVFGFKAPYSNQMIIYHAIEIMQAKWFRKLLIVMAFAAITGFSQTAALFATLVSPQQLTQELRKQQLQVAKENAFSRALDDIKRMPEPGLRLSARVLFLTYLWRDKATEEDKRAAAKMAGDAITDYSEHSKEIAPGMAAALLSDLGSLLEKREPKLYESLASLSKEQKREPDNIRALLETKGGDVRAAQVIRQNLSQGQEVGGLYFFLDSLREQKSKEFEPLLEEITNFAGRQLVSWDALFWVTEIYLQPELSPALKCRFLAMIVTRLQTDLTAGAPQRMAHKLLIKVLPAINSLTPELYSQALAQQSVLRAALADEEAQEARNKRLVESNTPVEDLIAEAEAAKSKPERNELLSSAAQLALKLNRFELCLAALEKIDADTAAHTPRFWRWHDQFLQQFVKATLDAKQPKLAEKAARRIFSPRIRVEAFILLISLQVKEKQSETAQALLLETIKIADTLTGQSEKARSFLLLSTICNQVDATKKTEMLQAAVKALNDIAKPDAGTNDDKVQYVQDLNNLGYQLAKVFKELAKENESAALALAEQLKQPDLRTYARLGCAIGLDSLLASKPPKST
jgi:hypothetical protein